MIPINYECTECYHEWEDRIGQEWRAVPDVDYDGNYIEYEEVLCPKCGCWTKGEI